MKRNRVKYNWIFMISDLGLSNAFGSYKASKLMKARALGKKEISEKRLARAFCLHYKYIIPYQCPCYVCGHEMPYSEYLKSRGFEDVH